MESSVDDSGGGGDGDGGASLPERLACFACRLLLQLQMQISFNWAALHQEDHEEGGDDDDDDDNDDNDGVDSKDADEDQMQTNVILKDLCRQLETSRVENS